jgi:signal transduction histidine kinase
VGIPGPRGTGCRGTAGTDHASTVVRALLWNPLVRDFGDYRHLDGGRTDAFLALDDLFPVVPGRVAVADFMEDFRRRQRMPLPAGVSLRWRIMPDVPAIVTDAAKLGLILEKLLGNAIKFTAAGWIVVSATDLPERQKVGFRVDDTGPGIGPEHLAPIFEPFHQLDAMSRGRGAVGLGLAVVRRYVALLDGEIAVRSEPGVGTTFDVRLPYRPRPATSAGIVRSAVPCAPAACS